MWHWSHATCARASIPLPNSSATTSNSIPSAARHSSLPTNRGDSSRYSTSMAPDTGSSPNVWKKAPSVGPPTSRATAANSCSNPPRSPCSPTASTCATVHSVPGMNYDKHRKFGQLWHAICLLENHQNTRTTDRRTDRQSRRTRSRA